MQDLRDYQQDLSADAKVSASFAHFFNNNKIDRWVLVSAFNSAQIIVGPEGQRILFNSIEELNKALTAIDYGKKENYKIALPGRLGKNLDKYGIPKHSLSYSEQLIYEALMWHFEAELSISMEEKNQRLVELSFLPGDHSAEILQLRDEIKAISTRATQLFVNELQKTDAKIHSTVFTRLYDYFAKPSLGRDIIIGIGLGLLTVGIIAGAVVASVGTAGIVPALLGTAALGMSAPVVAVTLAAIGTAVVGLFAAIAAGVGHLVRWGSDNKENELADCATQVVNNETHEQASTVKMFKGPLKPGAKPTAAPTEQTKKSVVLDKPMPVVNITEEDYDESLPVGYQN